MPSPKSLAVFLPAIGVFRRDRHGGLRFVSTSRIIKIHPVAMVAARIGVAVSFGLFLLVNTLEENSVHAEFVERTNEQADILRDKITRNVEVVHSIESLFAASNFVSREELAHFLRRPLSQFSGIRA